MSERNLRLAVAFLALAGAAIAAYLTYSWYSGNPPVCPTSGCELVQKSHWSKLVGIPVAALGLCTYLAVVTSTLIRHQLLRLGGAMIAVTALGFNLYLLYVQLVEIKSVCTWCVANEIVSALLAPTALAWLVVGTRLDAENKPAQ